MAQIQNQKQATKMMQRYLRRLSYTGKNSRALAIDGIFDTATRDALMEFQKSAGLKANGIADKLTWDTLFAEYRLAESSKERLPLYLFPEAPSNYAVSEGDTLMLVSVIQLLLAELSVTYDVLENIVVSGVYDRRTADAVREFQRINGLDATGKVDRATYNRIALEYSILDKIEQ